MKKELLCLILLIVTIHALPAQINYGKKTTPSAAPFKRNYRVFSSGIAIPLGAFAARDYSLALAGAAGAKIGTFGDYSKLRIFTKQQDRPYYFGLHTQLAGYYHPIRYNLPSGNYYEDTESTSYHFFPAGELKLGPAMVFPLSDRLMVDVNASIGATLAMPVLIGYSYYSEDYQGGVRTRTGSHLLGDQALAFGLCGGIGGNLRFGKLVAGLDLNFGKLRFDVAKGTTISTYYPNGTELNTESTIDETYPDEMHLTAIRLKIGIGW